MQTTATRPSKPYKGFAMEGFIAEWYNRNAGQNRGFAELADSIAKRLPANASVLEVAPGPGFLSIALAGTGVPATFSGLDISHSFVQIATANAHDAGVDIDFRHGDVAHMPYPDGSFDCIVCSAAFKNFSEPLCALDEMHRVLRPGGTASIYDLRRDASVAEIDAEVAAMSLSWASTLWTRFVFRTVLLRNAYSVEAIRDLAARSRFAGGDITTDRIGFELRLSRPAA